MVNKVELIGRLGQDPEQKTFDNGQSVVNLNLATELFWTDQNGQKQSKTSWHQVVVRNKSQNAIMQYLNKGSLISVFGRIDYQQRDLQDGGKITYTKIIANEVIFLDSKSSSNNDPIPNS